MEQKNLLAFSGGGIRAATFALGALKGLRQENQIEVFNHISAISGGGLTLAPLIYWFRLIRDQGVKLPLSDKTFKDFEKCVVNRMLKKGLWYDIIWNWKFFFWGFVTLIASAAIYSFVNRFICRDLNALDFKFILHTACWQALYIYTIMSIISVFMRWKSIIYWFMILSGILFITGFFFVETSFFEMRPWFFGQEINPFGIVNMVLLRILICILIILTALNILPLSNNKRDAIKRILKRIHKDIFGKGRDYKFTYSDPDNKYTDLMPVISATNMIKNRLVIFRNNEISEIGDDRYPWKMNTELDDIAVVTNFTCNFPCAFSPEKIELKNKKKKIKTNLLDGGILDNLGLWGPLFSESIHKPYKKVLSIDAGNPKKKFMSSLWFRILFKIIGSGVSRIESITVQVAALRNNLNWPDKDLEGFYFGHVDMSENQIDDIMKGLYKAWKRYHATDYSNDSGGEALDGISWVDDNHIKKLLKINKIDNELINNKKYFLLKVKEAIKYEALKTEVYGDSFDSLFHEDVKIVNKIKVNLGPLSDKEINAGIRLAQIITRVVMRVYLGNYQV